MFVTAHSLFSTPFDYNRYQNIELNRNNVYEKLFKRCIEEIQQQQQYFKSNNITIGLWRIYAKKHIISLLDTFPNSTIIFFEQDPIAFNYITTEYLSSNPEYKLRWRITNKSSSEKIDLLIIDDFGLFSDDDGSPERLQEFFGINMDKIIIIPNNMKSMIVPCYLEDSSKILFNDYVNNFELIWSMNLELFGISFQDSLISEPQSLFTFKDIIPNKISKQMVEFVCNRNHKKWSGFFGYFKQDDIWNNLPNSILNEELLFFPCRYNDKIQPGDIIQITIKRSKTQNIIRLPNQIKIKKGIYYEWQYTIIRDGKILKKSDIHNKEGKYHIFEQIPSEIKKYGQNEKNDIVDEELGLRVGDSTLGSKAGKGLFATRAFFPYEMRKQDIAFKQTNFIAEYTGEILTKKELDTRYEDKLAPYAIEVSKDKYIDAIDKSLSSLARYCNDALDASKYNAYFSRIKNDRIFLLAIAYIHPGEEIFADYGKEYWQDGTISMIRLKKPSESIYRENLSQFAIQKKRIDTIQNNDIAPNEVINQYVNSKDSNQKRPINVITSLSKQQEKKQSIPIKEWIKDPFTFFLKFLLFFTNDIMDTLSEEIQNQSMKIVLNIKTLEKPTSYSFRTEVAFLLERIFIQLDMHKERNFIQNVLSKTQFNLSDNQIIDFMKQIVKEIITRYPEKYQNKLGSYKRSLETSPFFEKTSKYFAKAKQRESKSFIDISFKVKVKSYSLGDYINPQYPEKSHEIYGYIPFSASNSPIKQIIKTDDSINFMKCEIIENPSSWNSIIGFQLIRNVNPKDEGENILHYTRKEPVSEGYILLEDIISSREGSNFIVQLMDPSYPRKPNIDSVLQITILHCNSQIQFKEPKKSLKEREKHLIHIDKVTEDIINKYFALFEHNIYVPSLKELKKMHVPRYPTTLFSCEFTRNNPEKMLKKCLLINLERYRMDSTQFIQSIDEANCDKLNICIKILCETCTLYANLCDYKSDQSKGSDCERFIDLFQNKTGDCDDSGKLSYLFMYLFHKGHFEHDALLHAAHKCSILFIPCMVEGVATTKSMPKEQSTEESKNHICHIYACIVPRWWFLEKVKVTKEFKGIIIEQLKNVHDWEKKCLKNIWILEGTNFSDPYPFTFDILHPDYSKIVDVMRNINEKRKELENLYPSFSNLGFQTENVNTSWDKMDRDGLSSFYRRIVSFWTSYLKDIGIPITDLTLCKREKEINYFGIPFADVVSMNDNIGLLPTFKYEQEELNLCLDIMNMQSPIIIDNVDIISIQTNVQRNLETISKSYPIPKESDIFQGLLIHPYISYRTNHESKISKEIISNIQQMLQDGMLISFDYKIYNLSSHDKNFKSIELRLYY